jgi:uncharacterized protein (UPF0261 family)
MPGQDRVPTVALLGTADTKGEELGFLADLLRAQGLGTLVIDAGTGEPRGVVPDVPNSEVARAAGSSVEALLAQGDRGAAVLAMTEGAKAILLERYDRGEVDAALGAGGSSGTSITAKAFRALPIGVPKVIVTTVAASDVRTIIGTSDLILVPSLVDLAGLNRISRAMLSNAAGAVAGMLANRGAQQDDGHVLDVGATMFANTMPAVQMIDERLGDSVGVIPFHGTDVGSEVLEKLVTDGLLGGVLDLTTCSLAQELIGGIWASGPERLRVWVELGVPVVVAPGALDMTVFGSLDTVPEHLRDRPYYVHNADITLVAVASEEAEQLGRIMGERLRGAEGRCSVCVPLGGFSQMGQPGQPFHDRRVTEAFLRGLKQTATVRVVEVESHINEPEFADAVAAEFKQILSAAGGTE